MLNAFEICGLPSTKLLGTVSQANLIKILVGKGVGLKTTYSKCFGQFSSLVEQIVGYFW